MSLSESWFHENREVNRAVNDLTRSTSAEQSRMRQTIRTQGEEFSKRLGRLEAGLMALVRLTDVREQLRPHEPARAVREYATSVISGGPPATPPDDVAGYWLAPAAHSVAAWKSGVGDGGAERSEALRRDRERATLFLVCTGVCEGTPDRVHDLVAELLPPASGDVSAAQRLVWSAAAAGRLGAHGRVAVAARLRDIVRAVPDDERRAELVRRVAARPPTGVRAAQDAAENLERLAAWLATVPTDTVPTTTVASPDDAGPSDDVERRTLAWLIAEGGPDDAHLLSVERECRGVLDSLGGQPTVAVAAPTPPQGDAWGLLTSDLGTAGRGVAASPDAAALRRLAVEVLSADFEALAEEWKATADAAPSSAARVAPAAAPVRAVPAASEPTRSDGQPSGDPARRRNIAYLALGLAVLAAVIGALTSPALFAVTALGVIVAAILLRPGQTMAQVTAARSTATTGTATPPGPAKPVMPSRSQRERISTTATRISQELARLGTTAPSGPETETETGIDTDIEPGEGGHDGDPAAI